MTERKDNGTDELLDSLLESRIAPGPEFTQRTVARAMTSSKLSDDSEASLEEWIEHELSAHRVEPSPRFNEEVVRRCHQETSPGPLIAFPFRLVSQIAATIAACVALLVYLSQGPANSPNTGNGDAETFAMNVSSSQPEPSSKYAESIDETTLTLLLLAEGLHQDSRSLLDQDNTKMLLAMAR